MPIVLKTLGDHIRKKRIENGQLQKDVAVMLQVSIDTITGWENNRSQPQLKHYPTIIAFLGYNPLELQPLTFAQSIRQYRLKHGLSIARMGVLVGVNASTILSWEKNEHSPLRYMQEKVLLILNTTPLE